MNQQRLSRTEVLGKDLSNVKGTGTRLHQAEGGTLGVQSTVKRAGFRLGLLALWLLEKSKSFISPPGETQCRK
jgi:hypothetical protein